MLALIDGDIAAYRAAAVTQKTLSWGDGGDPTVWANPAEAIRSALETIRLWGDAAGASKSLVFLTGVGNFRKSILPTYKSNRSGVVRPVALKATHEAIKDAYQTVIVDGLEADDLMGLTMTHRKTGASVIVSLDKDMRTVPGLHLNPSKDRDRVIVTEAEANLNWFTQALTGDACDGYAGCPKVGPVKAAALLAGWGGLDLAGGLEIVVGAFERAKMTAADALTSLRVARILRHGDYDKRNKAVRLWHPDTPVSLPLP